MSGHQAWEVSWRDAFGVGWFGAFIDPQNRFGLMEIVGKHRSAKPIWVTLKDDRKAKPTVPRAHERGAH